MSTLVASAYNILRVTAMDDLLDVVKVYLAWATEEGTPASVEHFVASLKTGESTNTVLLLRYGNTPVGFVDGELWYSAIEPYCVACSKYFYVLPDHRKASGRLYRAILKWAKGNGAATMRVIVDDEVASLRWQRHRFTPCALMLERSL